MTTLLEKAKQIPVEHNYRRPVVTEEEVELAKAWAKGEVTYNQFAIALGLNPRISATIYCRAVNIYKAIINNNYIRN